MRNSMPNRGFTLVELLAVIAIVGTLAALVLPAILSSREASREVQCQSNLKQISLAVLQHESAWRHFPSNGWGFLWLGDPDRGYGPRQPGGWIYNSLEYLERNDLRSMGRGQNFLEKAEALRRLAETPIQVFSCPSRSTGAATPFAGHLQPRNAYQPSRAAKSDYAINEGDFATETGRGPESLAAGDSPDYRWEDTSKATGVSFQRSQVRASQVRDGLSNTYLLGEKHVSAAGAADASDPSHDQSMYCGVDWDIARWTIEPPLRDDDVPHTRRFGSSHARACGMAFCDGHVETVSFEIDPDVHRRYGNRSDSVR